MTDQRAIFAELKELEEELLTPQARRNRDRLRQLLAEEFEEVGSSGRVFGRQEVLQALAQEQAGADVELSLQNFRAHPLESGLVQVRYQSRRRTVNGDRIAERTSLWRREGTGWQMIYHQGTPIARS